LDLRNIKDDPKVMSLKHRLKAPTRFAGRSDAFKWQKPGNEGGDWLVSGLKSESWGGLP